MSWSDVRTALQTQLEAAGLIAKDVMPNALSEIDVAVVLPGDPLIEPYAHGDLDVVYIRVEVRSTRGDQKSGQNALDTLIKQTRAAIESDDTIGGKVQAARFDRVHSYGSITDQPGTFVATLDLHALMEAA